MQRNGKFPPRQAQRGRTVESARRLALDVLQDVSRQDAYASLAFGSRIRESKLSQRDRDLAAELVYGTLERRITLDYFIGQKLRQPELESLVRDILRLGAYQILYLTRVPDSAAVDESVKLARTLGREAFAGLINGVLRGIVRDKEQNALAWPSQEDPVRYLSIRHSLPAWIVKRLVEAYGEQEAELIAAYRPKERAITIRRTQDRLSKEAFEAMMTQKGWKWTPAKLPDAYYASGLGDVGIEKSYLLGEYSVQGEGSMLAAMAVHPKRGGSVLDACAAPGGKTAYMAELLHGTGRVYAWDVHEHRVELIRSMTKRLKLDNVRPAVRDATVVKEDMTWTMDAVLLDAPCSGLGVMLSKPDVKYRQTPEAVTSLRETQRRLLDACCQYVKPGGALVYATCTILPEENGGQVRAFLERHPEFEPDEEGLKAALPAFLKDRIEGGMLQLFAHRDEMEGFFIARLRRRKG